MLSTQRTRKLDLTLSMFVPAATNIHHATPQGPIGKPVLFVCFNVSCYYTGALGKMYENLWESLEGIMVNGSLGRSLEYLIYSLGRILKAPLGFSKGKPLATSSAGPKAINPRGLRPLGFLLLVWPWMWPWVCLQKIPWGTFNLCPREYIEYSRKATVGLHSPCYLLALPTDCPRHIEVSFMVVMILQNQTGQAPLITDPPRTTFTTLSNGKKSLFSAKLP